MKSINKFSVKIVVSILAGLVLACAGTKITYACAPTDGAAGCVSFDKAVMHLSDLFSNKQDSLVHFFETFVITSLVVFALLNIFGLVQKRTPKPAGQVKA